MPKSRRQFLTRASIGFLVSASGCSRPTEQSGELPPGAPPAFGTAPDVGPPVSTATFAEAEKLVQFPLSASERETAAGNWRKSMAPLYERRTGQRKLAIEAAVAPATQWNPALPGVHIGPDRDRFIRSKIDSGPLPATDGDVAFATVTQLSRWIETRALTSQRLTAIYLDRLQRFDPKLRCVITLTPDVALRQSKQADAEIAAGHYRGPLHGIPFGVKDLLDTAGHPNHLWRRTLSESRTGSRFGGGEASARCWRGTGGETQSRRAGA